MLMQLVMKARSRKTSISTSQFLASMVKNLKMEIRINQLIQIDKFNGESTNFFLNNILN
jgi:hypothetical protein